MSGYELDRLELGELVAACLLYDDPTPGLALLEARRLRAEFRAGIS